MPRVLCAVLVLSFSACTANDRTRPDAPDSAMRGVNASAGDTALHARPMPGATRDSMPGAVAVAAQSTLWDDTTVVARLRAANLDPERMGGVRQPFLGVPGMRLVIAHGTAEVQAFLYADAGAVGRDTKPLDTIRVAPRTMQIAWIMPPSLIVNNNLAVIVLTRNEALRRRIKLAFTTNHR